MLELLVTIVLAIVKVGAGILELVAIAFEAIGMARRKTVRDDERDDAER